MIKIRPSNDRGHIKYDWLDTRHTFSFGDYYDPEHMGFRSLRVINQDIIKAATGFGTHPHRDMEIITYVLQGGVAHKDSMGNSGVVRAGEVQRMTAGTGVQHSEYNASETEDLKLLQIWILPNQKGLEPGYEQISVSQGDKTDQLRHIASLQGGEGQVLIHQDVSLFASILSPQKQLAHNLESNRHAWIQVISGVLDVNGQALTAGDGAAVTEESELKFVAKEESEFLLFDLN